MDPISSTDRLVLILREKLAERAKVSQPSAASASAARRQDPAATGMDNVQALAAIEGVDDRQLGRALIQSILTDEFGADLINEAKFQQVVDQVVDVLQSDPASGRLLTRILDELRASAR